MQIHDKEFTILINEHEILNRVAKLGAELTIKYIDKNPLFVIILNGAFVFGADLIRNFKGECELYFTRIRSYSGTSSGELKDFTGFDASLENRHIVFVEDIIDTGKTIYHLITEIKNFNPASITTVTFLQKKILRPHLISADFVGFEIEDEFVVGYGLDYDGLGRNLNAIWKTANVAK